MSTDRPMDIAAALDETDWKTLRALQARGRVSWSELADALALSRPSAADRVRRLEEIGAIKGFTTVLEPRAVGLGVLAFLGVVMEHPKYRAPFIKLVRGLPEILECHHVTGEFDYLLKVRCRDTDALEELISNGLKGIRALVRTRTMIALSSVKDSAALPLRPPTPLHQRGRR